MIFLVLFWIFLGVLHNFSLVALLKSLLLCTLEIISFFAILYKQFLHASSVRIVGFYVCLCRQYRHCSKTFLHPFCALEHYAELGRSTKTFDVRVIGSYGGLFPSKPGVLRNFIFDLGNCSGFQRPRSGDLLRGRSAAETSGEISEAGLGHVAADGRWRNKLNYI